MVNLFSAIEDYIKKMVASAGVDTLFQGIELDRIEVFGNSLGVDTAAQIVREAADVDAACMEIKKILIEGIIQDLISYLCYDKKNYIYESMSTVYNSIVYAKLCDEDTGLYRESSSYI